MKASIGIRDIREAYQRIYSHIHKTPVLECNAINQIVNAHLFFKCENFQKVGAFKFRGACNAVFSLTDEEAQSGVVTHSSGNHAAALALASAKRGITAYIVMPSDAPKIKIDAVKEYGAQITFCEPTLKSRESTTQIVIDKSGARMIHPYNDHDIIAGQGTAVLELLEEINSLEVIITPVGGGGLLSGTAIYAKNYSENIKVVGSEPKNADDAFRSKKAGKIIPSENPQTIADGLRTSLGNLTFPIVRDFVDEITLVSEKEIIAAMKIIFERMKIVVEPSAAVALAAVLFKKIDVGNKNVGIILSGGNVDLNTYFDLLKY